MKIKILPSQSYKEVSLENYLISCLSFTNNGQVILPSLVQQCVVFFVEVIHEKFFFISFSVMLDLRHLSEVEEYEKVVPCEVSIVEYSIEQGLEREIHKFIKPGRMSL